MTLKCDICKKPTMKIVGKLNYIPMIPGVSRGVHSNYTHHADVGVCCGTKLLKVFDFRERMTAEEYQSSRRSA
jgi:hypothetical protein